MFNFISYSTENKENLIFNWDNKEQWEVYEVKNQPWGYVYTIYKKSESWNNWTSKITYMKMVSGKSFMISKNMENLKNSLKNKNPNVELHLEKLKLNSENDAMVISLEPNNIKDGKSLSYLLLLVETKKSLFMFQVTEKSTNIKVKEKEYWKKQFKTAYISNNSEFKF